MRFLRWIGIVVAALVVVVALVFAGARFADGPVAMIPGGALRSGELVETPDIDWTFAADVPTIELQNLENEIEIALQAGGINDDDRHVGLAKEDEVAGDLLVDAGG